MKTTKQFKVDAMALLLIIEVKINLSFGFDKANIKQTNCKMYMHYTVQLYCSLKIGILKMLSKNSDSSTHTVTLEI